MTNSPKATNGTHAGDGVAEAGRRDASNGYEALLQLPYDTSLTGQELGGQTIYPGVYIFTSSAGLNGILTLDARGNTSAIFVFQVRESFLCTWLGWLAHMSVNLYRDMAGLYVWLSVYINACVKDSMHP